MAGLLKQMSVHERVEALLSPYLDGRVSDDERAFVERHIESCVDCARSLATLQATVAAVRAMPHVRAPRSFALPRSVAKRPQTAPWMYPLLRTASVAAASLFVLMVAGDLFTRAVTPMTTVSQMAAPAALAPTSVAMERAAPAPQWAAATQALPTAIAGRHDESVVTAAPQMAAPAAPAPTGRQLAATEPGPAPAYDGATPGAASKGMPPASAPQPSTEAPLVTGAPGYSAGVGGGAAEGGPPAGAPAAPPPAPAQLSGEAATATSTRAPAAATVQPTLTPLAVAQVTAAPTQIAHIPAPQPETSARGAAPQATPPTVSPFPIAEGALAILAIVLGVAAWVVRRRSR